MMPQKRHCSPGMRYPEMAFDHEPYPGRLFFLYKKAGYITGSAGQEAFHHNLRWVLQEQIIKQPEDQCPGSNGAI